ncbi:Proteophosphoglycan ppg4 [Rhodotorula toruloides]|nr:Proteophosphoglycan ppg4 [Rhodotorula toruloides]
MFSGWFRSSPNKAIESMQPSDYPRHFDDSDIARVLKSLGERLWPEPGPHEKAEIRRVQDWESLREAVYSRAYGRLGFEGKQAIHAELTELLKAVMKRKITCDNLPSLFGPFATSSKATIGNHTERAVLVESDGTVVGYLDALHDIVHQDQDYRGDYEIAKLERETERVSILSELDHVVSAIERFNAPLGVGERRELLHTTLTTLLKHGVEFKKRRYEPHHGGSHDVSHYASLSHPLLGQPLSSRKARIYGMV